MVHVRLSSVLRPAHLQGLSLLVAATAALLTGCSRTELFLDDGLPLSVQDAAADDASDGGLAEDSADVSVPVPPEAAPPPDPCANMPPIPCPGGGYEYCVAGAYSACPQRCSVCVPGSQEVCFITYCHAWGIQTCAADGLSFGYCQEESRPSVCASAGGNQDQASAALEQCCIDNGYCCQDQFDLNGNGTTGEPIGQCSGVTCSP